MARTESPRRTFAALILLGLVAAVCVSLGQWQLDRAALRKETQRTMELGRNSAILRLTAATDAGELRDWRHAIAQGVWKPELTVLIENRNHNGRPGYWVATPLLLEATPPHAVLVLRGWLPRVFASRDQAARQGVPATGLPDPALLRTPDGVQQIQGQLLAHVPRIVELWSFSGREASALPPRLPDPAQPVPVVTNLGIDAYAASTGLAFLPAILQQLPDAPGAEAQPQARPEPRMIQEWGEPSLDADKNIGYAVQWFGFASIAAGAFLVVAWRAMRRKRRPAD